MWLKSEFLHSLIERQYKWCWLVDHWTSQVCLGISQVNEPNNVLGCVKTKNNDKPILNNEQIIINYISTSNPNFIRYFCSNRIISILLSLLWAVVNHEALLYTALKSKHLINTTLAASTYTTYIGEVTDLRHLFWCDDTGLIQWLQ